MARLAQKIGWLGLVLALCLPTGAAWANDPNDEIVFYSDDGLFRFYDVDATGGLGDPFMGGPSYTRGWDTIAAVDLEGDGVDEALYYREDGLYAYYRINEDGTLGSRIRTGTNYTRGWDSIVPLDLDGDSTDELLFYRQDGLYAYFDVTSTGSTATKIRGGTNYTKGWSSIVALDLDSDSTEELLFYRRDGLYAYFDVTSTGSTGTKIRGGTNYTKDWNSIASVDLDGDSAGELLFYRSGDGLFGYFDVSPTGSTGSKIRGGNYSSGWEIISAIDVGDPPPSPVAPNPSQVITFGDGTRRIGPALPPGTYRTTALTLDYCYWERLSGLSGELEDIISNEFTASRSIVTIQGSDHAFSSSDCGTFSNRFPHFWRTPTAPLPEGDYLVRAEVQPGQWTASDPANCYWERVSGFSGGLEDVLANEYTSSPTSVYITESDAGFRSSGCGTWVYNGR